MNSLKTCALSVFFFSFTILVATSFSYAEYVCPNPSASPSPSPIGGDTVRPCTVFTLEGVDCSGILAYAVEHLGMNDYFYSVGGFGCTKNAKKKGEELHTYLVHECEYGGVPQPNCLVVSHSLGAIAAYNNPVDGVDYLYLDPPYAIDYGIAGDAFSSNHRQIRAAARRGIRNSCNTRDWTDGTTNPSELHTPWDYNLGFGGSLEEVRKWIIGNCPRR